MSNTTLERGLQHHTVDRGLNSRGTKVHLKNSERTEEGQVDIKKDVHSSVSDIVVVLMKHLWVVFILFL